MLARPGWMKSPFGKPGDRLWVRETFWITDEDGGSLVYEATRFHETKQLAPTFSIPLEGLEVEDPRGPSLRPKMRFGKHPSIHMPRWASRITLEVLRVWAERVQDISEEDAKAEGVRLDRWRICEKDPVYEGYSPIDGPCYRNGFGNLWNSIYSKRGLGWGANPWDWATEFRRIKP